MKRENDVKSLSDKDLIGVILEKDTKNPDNRVLLRDVTGMIKEKQQNLLYEDLLSLPGVGQKTAVKIMACFEISRRYYPQPALCDKITRPEDILPLVKDIRVKVQEHFVCITLNGAGELLGNRIITIGLLNHSLVHPREVFADAIADRAASIVCIHNHPSGSLEPSSQDIAITRQLKEAGTLIGISLIDHIIVTKTGYTSMRERGLV